ncbi:RNA-binding protein [uncultured Massilia sp.]|uniref:RNA-binding protein n=1 Tax=uncultured Massilia sp. TaxID=169973 RepID=UPI0025E417AB|nr:RNA-binding protein [uncultured Massilia sp.]
MQVVLSGLCGDDCEDSVSAHLSRYLRIEHVCMIRDGKPDSPWALLEVGDSYERVWDACNALRGVFHRGKQLRLYIPLHQTGT